MSSGDQVVVVIDEAEICAARMTASAAGSEVVRRPLSVVTDGVGDPVPVRTPRAAHQAVDGLLTRVGDPVPVRVGTRTWPAEALVALVVADAAAAVADESAAPLVLVLPDEWRAHRRELLRSSVAQLTEKPVTTLSAALGVVDFGLADESSAPVLVLEAGNESVRAHLFTHGGGGPQGPRTGWCDWGGNDIDDALVDFVRDRSPSVRGTGAQDAEDVRAACASARADLARRTATEVELPGRDPVRLVRADLELLVGGTVADVVEQVVADALDPHGDRPSRVLVTGPLATLPMVVEAVSAAVGTSVEHVTDEQALKRYSSAAVLARESAAVADDVETDEREDDTRALPLASPPPARRRHGRHHRHSRHHRTAILVAASLAVAAPVAAMTMTDAGEATLLSMVDGIVPQESSDDTASDDLLGRLTDAATLPALPWGDEDEADTPAAPIGTGGGPTGEVGTQGPAPTSTHGAGKDEDQTDEKKDGKDGKKDKGTDKKDKGKEKSEKDKGKKDKGKKDKGTRPDKGSANSSSSSSGRTPNENSTSSAGGPSTPDGTTSSEPDTPDPTTSTSEPDPTTTTPEPEPTTTEPEPTTTAPEPDPTTTAAEPDPTTTAAEPDPSTTSTASTTSATTTVAAPVAPGTTNSPELGTL